MNATHPLRQPIPRRVIVLRIVVTLLVFVFALVAFRTARAFAMPRQQVKLGVERVAVDPTTGVVCYALTKSGTINGTPVALTLSCVYTPVHLPPSGR